MTRYRTRRSRARRWTEKILLLAGIAGLGVWAWSVAGRAVYQDWENWAFDRQARGELATVGEYVRSRLKLPAPPRPPTPPSFAPPAAPPPVGNNEVVGRLSIPKLDLHAMVREGVDEKTLGLALGHIPGTALPGQSGNVGVAGHRDTLFRSLRGIHRNDLIWFETSSGSHEYRVESTQVVKPQDVSVLAAHQSPELTLVTCYPFYYVGAAPDRFIVKAREVLPEMAAALPVEQEPKSTEPVQVSKAEEPVEVSKAEEHKPGVKRIAFEIRKNHSRELTPGISMGVTGTDASSRRVDGWMWVMPERRTIWLRDHSAHEPVIFYGHVDGKMRELVITSVAGNSVRGYLLSPESGRN
jgi:sortase A